MLPAGPPVVSDPESPSAVQHMRGGGGYCSIYQHKQWPQHINSSMCNLGPQTTTVAPAAAEAGAVVDATDAPWVGLEVGWVFGLSAAACKTGEGEVRV